MPAAAFVFWNKLDFFFPPNCLMKHPINPVDTNNATQEWVPTSHPRGRGAPKGLPARCRVLGESRGERRPPAALGALHECSKITFLWVNSSF